MLQHATKFQNSSVLISFFCILIGQGFAEIGLLREVMRLSALTGARAHKEDNFMGGPPLFYTEI